jgi:hypothetical protein
MGRWLSERVNMSLLVAAFDGAHYNAADVIASGCATPVRTSAPCKGGLTDHGTGLGKPAPVHASTEPGVGLPDFAEEQRAHSVWQAGQRSERHLITENKERQ